MKPSSSAKPNRVERIQKALHRAGKQHGTSLHGDLEFLTPAVLALPDLWAAAAERGQQAMLHWLLHQPQGRDAQGAFRAAVAYDLPEVLEFLLGRMKSVDIKFPKWLDDELCSFRCLLILAKAGCPVQLQYAHRVSELEEAHRLFMEQVGQAKALHPELACACSPPSCRLQRGSLRNATSSELLGFLARLPAELVDRIAAEAFLAPEDAKRIQWAEPSSSS